MKILGRIGYHTLGQNLARPQPVDVARDSADAARPVVGFRIPIGFDPVSICSGVNCLLLEPGRARLGYRLTWVMAVCGREMSAPYPVVGRWPAIHSSGV